MASREAASREGFLIEQVSGPVWFLVRVALHGDLHSHTFLQTALEGSGMVVSSNDGPHSGTSDREDQAFSVMPPPTQAGSTWNQLVCPGRGEIKVGRGVQSRSLSPASLYKL